MVQESIDTSTQHEQQTTPELKQGADLFFQAALQYGYKYIFGNPGTTEALFMDALSRYPDLNFVLCLHENVATGAAAGYAQMTGRPALVNVHLAPGLTNGLANIHNARKSGIPMVVTVGEHDTRHLIEDSDLHEDIESIARGICKWTWTVRDAGELAAALNRATLQAMTHPQGPVCLVLPTNVLSATPLTPDGAVPTIPALEVSHLGAVATEDVTRAAETLLEARLPILLIGEVEATDLPQIAELANLLNARVIHDRFLSRMDGKALPGSERFPYFPHQRRAMLSQADVLLLIGVGGFTTLFFYENDPAPVVGQHTRVIHLDDDLSAVGKNERGSLPLYGNISTGLQQLVTEIQARRPQAKPASENAISAIRNAATEQTAGAAPTQTTALTPLTLMQALPQVLAPNTLLFDEAITAREAVVSGIIDVSEHVSSYLTNRGGALGSGMTFPIGIQLAAPNNPVISIVGDGSAMYVIQGLWTMARYQLPILTIICNNASYDIIKLEVLRLRGTLAAQGVNAVSAITNLNAPRLNFAQMAEGMGVQAWTVQDSHTLAASLQAASEVCGQGKPALVDVYLQSPIS